MANEINGQVRKKKNIQKQWERYSISLIFKEILIAITVTFFLLQKFQTSKHKLKIRAWLILIPKSYLMTIGFQFLCYSNTCDIPTPFSHVP